MPRRPASPCTWPGCPAFATDGGARCPNHPYDTQGWTGSSHDQDHGLPQRTLDRILHRDQGVCHICRTPGATVVDHVTPRAEGGTNDDANLAAIHARPCHLAKTQAEAARGRARRHSR